MATYIVFTRESMQDQQEFDLYQSKVGATLAGHPVKVLAAYGPQETLEGEGPEGVVIVEFPSKEAAHAVSRPGIPGRRPAPLQGRALSRRAGRRRLSDVHTGCPAARRDAGHPAHP